MVYLTDPQYLPHDFPFSIFDSRIPDKTNSILVGGRRLTSEEVMLHCHECLELNYITGGEGLDYVDDHVYPIREGDVLIMNNYEYHGLVGKKDLRLKVLVFEPQLVWNGDPEDYQYLKTFYEWKNDFRHCLPNSVLTGYIATIFFELQHEWERRTTGYRLIIKSLLLKLLALLYRGFESSEQSSQQMLDFTKNYCKIQDAVQYIDGRVSEPFSLEELAGIVHMNPCYFSTLFTKLMGLSPFAYINKKRIEYASRQLLTSTKSITEIAIEAGFCNISYFNRVFRRFMGQSPGQFRAGRAELLFPPEEMPAEPGKRIRRSG